MTSSFSGVRAFSSTARSAYISRLRRAFLLRAHPDRFRSFEPLVRQRQETLLKEISNRMNQPDFLAFTYGECSNETYSRKDVGSLDFSLIQNDGSLLHQRLDLNQRVEGVLHAMALALTLTGAAPMPPPPLAPKADKSPQKSQGIHWAPESSKTSVDHRYDIHSIRGRDLRYFLQQLETTQVQIRRSHRLDVTAAALIVRQRFGFSAVDGTGLGWSSESFAVLLRSLSALHEAHCAKLITTFYPFRLVWSSEEYDDPLDVYGGIFYLNPASTPLQWLQQLLKVTENRIEDHKRNQAVLVQNTRTVSSHLGVKFVKGYSCQSKEYHALIERLANFLGVAPADQSGTSAVALERVQVTAESAQVSRRSTLTKDGTIRIGTAMSIDTIVLDIARLAPDARKRVKVTELSREAAKATVNRAYVELGVEKVSVVKPLKVEDTIDALTRLLELEDRDLLRKSLAGNALAIASSGQFCHLGDDGSFVIPLDWH